MQYNQKIQNIGFKFEFDTQDIVISEALTDTKYAIKGRDKI